MFAKLRLFGDAVLTLTAAAALAVVAAVPTGPASAADPIKIGLGMSLTGKLAGNGKTALLGMQIWEDIYAKLLDVDKVDLIVCGYASTHIAAAMPIAIERKKLFIGLSGTGINDAFQYPLYFAMIPTGPNAKPASPWASSK
jgi:branched-chain amino acid transport system substrate-binding protein